MTATSSGPGRDTERYLADIFDQLTAAGSPDAALRIAARAASELAEADGLCLLAAGGDRCVVALPQQQICYRDLRSSGLFRTGSDLHGVEASGPQLVWGKEEAIELPGVERLHIGVALVVPLRDSSYLAVAFFWRDLQGTDPQRTRRLELLAKALGLVALAWQRDRAAAEVQHRLRNSLAATRSIIRRSSETSQSAEHFALHLEARIGALARAEGSLSAAGAAGVDLEEIVRTELIASAVTDRSCTVQGPAVRLNATSAQTLALAVHELATNSVKFGALAAPLGQLAIRWAITEGAAPLLRISWSESGVTIASVAPRRRGFGQELIESTLPYELGASTRLTLRPGGLLCEMDIPLEACATIAEPDTRLAMRGAGSW
jgi:two-component sensor histidine kinase